MSKRAFVCNIDKTFAVWAEPGEELAEAVIRLSELLMNAQDGWPEVTVEPATIAFLCPKCGGVDAAHTLDAISDFCLDCGREFTLEDLVKND